VVGQAGLAFIPMALAIIIGAQASPRLLPTVGRRPVLGGGAGARGRRVRLARRGPGAPGLPGPRARAYLAAAHGTASALTAGYDRAFAIAAILCLAGLACSLVIPGVRPGRR
jgi:hypothetical protein